MGRRVGLGVTRMQAAAATFLYPQMWLLPRSALREMSRALAFVRPVRTASGIFTHPYAPPIGGKAFGRYLTGLRRMAHGQRVPLVAHLSVTDRCPCECLRCSNLGSSQVDPAFPQLRSLISRLRDAGTVRVAFTGGEPALRDDLGALIEACRPDISPQLFTSGVGMDRTKAMAWRQAGLEAAFVSLDHWRSDVHDAARRTPGSHAKAVEAIRAFVEVGTYTSAQAVVGDELLAEGELERFLNFCRGLGAHEVMLLEPVKVRGAQGAQGITSTQRQRLVDLHRSCAQDESSMKVMAMSLLESEAFVGCQAGISFLYVASSGEVCPCDFVPLSFGNGYEDHLDDILARMTRCLPGASCKCLATTVSGLPSGRMIPWDQSRRMLESYKPGPPPQLLGWCDNQGGHGR